MRSIAWGCVAWGCALVIAAALVSGLAGSVAVALPTGSAYEMVTPLYKGGYGALGIEGVSPEGNRVAFYSPGAFAGAPASANIGIDYVAERGSQQWSTVPVMPPASVLALTAARDISPNLESTLVLGKPGSNSEGAFQEGTEALFLEHPIGSSDASATWQQVGQSMVPLPPAPVELRYEAASPRFCHLVFANVTSGALLPVAIGEAESSKQLYELNRGCGGERPSLGFVALDNAGKPIAPDCKVDLGVEDFHSSHQTQFGALATEGQETFFTTCVTPLGFAGPHQLFVRLAGTKTLEISKPLGPGTCDASGEEIPCESAATRESANFAGASEDGSKVFFTTAAPLMTADKDSANDLYMASIECPSGGLGCEVAKRVVTSLVLVSADPNGAPANVQDIVRLSRDGQRIYFVAKGDLLDSQEQQRLQAAEMPVPVVGADNFYVYDSATGTTQFIGDLCAGNGHSGEVEDAQCPASGEAEDTPLWAGGVGVEAQLSNAEGTYLLFATYAQLAPNDTDEAKDIYRYDAQTDSLTRVSHGEGGTHENGNGPYEATIPHSLEGGTLQDVNEMGTRAISEDGMRAIFTSAEPLSPMATNHLTNVYEWSAGVSNGEGEVSLISSGSSTGPDYDAVISADGRNVFFDTVQGLAPQDTDGAPDIYDAREGGGFPSVPVPVQPCQGEGCKGPLTPPASILAPPSALLPFSTPAAPVTNGSLKPKKTKASKAKARRGKSRERAKKSAGGKVAKRATRPGAPANEVRR